MQNYVILTDSCCDLPAVMADNLGLKVIPLSVTMGDKEYLNYLDEREISFSEFYRKLGEEKRAKTSAISIGDFDAALVPILEEGLDVLMIIFSSALSATCQSAQIAAEDMRLKFPDRNIKVVDSLSASLGEGLLVWTAARLKDEGKSLDEVYDIIEQKKKKLCHWFTVDSLIHLQRGGRIPLTTAIAGTILGIKPVLHVDNSGRLVNVSKTRGRNASLLALADKIGELGEDIQNQTIFISHGNCEEEAKNLAEEIKKRFGVKEVVVNFVGPVIGSHSGQGTMAVFFFGKER